MLSSLEPLDDGKTRRLVAISASVEWIRER